MAGANFALIKALFIGTICELNSFLQTSQVTAY